ncbi:MAG: MFS transporter [Acetobacteraceae bacterium]
MPSRQSLYGLDGVNFFIAAVQTGFGAFVAVYLTENRWTPAQVGFALTISTICGLISQVPAGALVDRMRDKRHAVRTGTLGVGIGAVLLATTPSEPAVYLAEALQGLGSSLIGPGIAATSLALVGHKAFSERIGRNARYASIGNGLTAGVLGAVGSYFAPRWVFILTAALTLPVLLSLALIHTKPAAEAAVPAAQKPEETASWAALKSLLLDRRLLTFAICIVLFFLSSAAMLPIAATEVTKHHPKLADAIIAVTILLPQAVVALISPWIGRKSERSGRRPMLLLGWSLLPLQAALYVALPAPIALTLAQVLSGASGAAFGVMMTLVAADITRGTGRFNLTLGLLGVAVSVGASLSTSLAGVLATTFNDRSAFVGLALAGLCGVLLLFVGMPETRPPEDTPDAATKPQ